MKQMLFLRPVETEEKGAAVELDNQIEKLPATNGQGMNGKNRDNGTTANVTELMDLLEKNRSSNKQPSNKPKAPSSKKKPQKQNPTKKKNTNKKQKTTVTKQAKAAKAQSASLSSRIIDENKILDQNLLALKQYAIMALVIAVAIGLFMSMLFSRYENKGTVSGNNIFEQETSGQIEEDLLRLIREK